LKINTDFEPQQKVDPDLYRNPWEPSTHNCFM